VNTLEANLKALYTQDARLQQRHLERAAPPEGLEIRTTPSGRPTARLRGTFLHSSYDPVVEAKRLLEQQLQRPAGAELPRGAALPGAPHPGAPHPGAALFYGFGLGYLVEAYAALYPGSPVVVVEPDAGLFVEALRHRELTRLLSLPHLFWHIGEEPDAVLMSLDGLPLAHLQVFRPRSLYALHAEYFQRMDLLLRALMDKRQVNLNTLRRFGRLWIRNLLRNLETFAACPGVGRLFGELAGVPALVVAAGPSLDPLLPLLPELHRRLLVVAVDTSHGLCLAAGVRPDLLVCVDPQYWNTRHLDWRPIDDTILVSEASVNPRTFHQEGFALARTCFVSSFFPLGLLLEQRLGGKGTVGAGGSVATTAWDLARALGCPQIYMAGLDLGFPGKRTHCRGAFFEESMHTASTRLRSAEQGILAYLYQAGSLALPNNAGGSTLTDRRMLVYKWWFENQMKQQRAASGPATFNLSPEGLAIEGMPYMDARTLLELPPRRGVVDARLRSAWPPPRSRELRLRSAQRRRLAGTLWELEGELQRLSSVAGRGERICRRLMEAGGRLGTGSLAELEEIDRGILEISSRQIASFLFQPLIRKVLDGTGGGTSDTGGGCGQALETSRDLYRELADSARYHLGLLQPALARLGAPRGG
jgi:hypothetical protein